MGNEKPTVDYQDSEERIEKILKLVERGIDHDESVGFHGTSIHAVKHLIGKGTLPGGMIEAPNQEYVHGDLFFYPLNPHTSPSARQKAIEDTAPYAAVVAQRHAFINLLGLDFSQKEHHAWANAFTAERSLDWDDSWVNKQFENFVAFRLGKARSTDALSALKKEIQAAARNASEWKGFVLALDPSVQRDFEIKPGDPGEGDRCISCPEGLSLSYLSGIRACGPQEENFLETLRHRKGHNTIIT